MFPFSIDESFPYIYEKDSTLGVSQKIQKISLLSSLINGSKLTFPGSCDRRLPSSAMFNVHSHLKLRISYRVLIETRDLETFHSIEEYRVSLILKNCDFFRLFSPKRSYSKAKNTHF